MSSTSHIPFQEGFQRHSCLHNHLNSLVFKDDVSIHSVSTASTSSLTSPPLQIINNNNLNAASHQLFEEQFEEQFEQFKQFDDAKNTTKFNHNFATSYENAAALFGDIPSLPSISSFTTSEDTNVPSDSPGSPGSPKNKQRSHHYSENKTEWPCRKCENFIISFATKTELYDHIKQYHWLHCSNFIPYQCTAVFPNEEKLLIHLREQHGIIPKSPSNSLNDMNIKNMTQNKIKRRNIHNLDLDNVGFSCWKCDKHFEKKKYLEKHLERHLKKDGSSSSSLTSRPKCNVCGKSFSDNTRLKIHSRIHTGEKPFLCQICNQSFSDPSAYRRHVAKKNCLKSKSVIEEIRCPVCEKPFKSQTWLDKHVASKHDGNQSSKIRVENKKKKNKKNKKNKKKKKKKKKKKMKINRKEEGKVVPKIQCAVCDCECQSNDALLQHILEAHSSNSRQSIIIDF